MSFFNFVERTFAAKKKERLEKTENQNAPASDLKNAVGLTME